MAYISNELTHFIDAKHRDDQPHQFKTLLKIFDEHWLMWDPSNPHATGVMQYPDIEFCDERYKPYAVCFCDIPKDDLWLHMQKYGRFGIAFTKKFMLTRGANPVFYIAKEAVLWPNKRIGDESGRIEPMINDLFARLRKARAMFEDADVVKPDPTHPKAELLEIESVLREIEFWLFPFFKGYEELQDHQAMHHYYMEREWRALRNVSFTRDDIARLYLPAEYIPKCRDAVPKYTGPIEDSDEIMRKAVPLP